MVIALEDCVSEVRESDYTVVNMDPLLNTPYVHIITII